MQPWMVWMVLSANKHDGLYHCDPNRCAIDNCALIAIKFTKVLIKYRYLCKLYNYFFLNHVLVIISYNIHTWALNIKHSCVISWHGYQVDNLTNLAAYPFHIPQLWNLGRMYCGICEQVLHFISFCYVHLHRCHTSVLFWFFLVLFNLLHCI